MKHCRRIIFLFLFVETVTSLLAIPMEQESPFENQSKKGTALIGRDGIDARSDSNSETTTSGSIDRVQTPLVLEEEQEPLAVADHKQGDLDAIISGLKKVVEQKKPAILPDQLLVDSPLRVEQSSSSRFRKKEIAAASAIRFCCLNAVEQDKQAEKEEDNGCEEQAAQLRGLASYNKQAAEFFIKAVKAMEISTVDKQDEGFLWQKAAYQKLHAAEQSEKMIEAALNRNGALAAQRREVTAEHQQAAEFFSNSASCLSISKKKEVGSTWYNAALGKERAAEQMSLAIEADLLGYRNSAGKRREAAERYQQASRFSIAANKARDKGNNQQVKQLEKKAATTATEAGLLEYEANHLDAISALLTSK